MYRKIIILCSISVFLLVGCTSRQANAFDHQLKAMYITSIREVIHFKEIDQSTIKKEEKVKKLVEACEAFIKEIEDFQNIEIPDKGEKMYKKVNDLAMHLSNTLVTVAYFLDQGDAEQYTQYKDELAFFFIEAGYLGEELGDYLGEEDFVEDIMVKYQ